MDYKYGLTGEKGNGVNPVRTRHRISRAREEVSTGRPGRIGCVRVISRELRFRSTGMRIHATSNWQYER